MRRRMGTRAKQEKCGGDTGAGGEERSGACLRDEDAQSVEDRRAVCCAVRVEDDVDRRDRRHVLDNEELRVDGDVCKAPIKGELWAADTLSPRCRQGRRGKRPANIDPGRKEQGVGEGGTAWEM